MWDTLFYSQTLGTAPPRVFKFQSDVNLAHAYTGEWQSFEGAAGQAPWDAVRVRHSFFSLSCFAFSEVSTPREEDANSVNEQAYAKEYVRLSLLGVYNINDLTECTQAVPQMTTYWAPADQAYADAWASTDSQSATVADAMMNGDLLSSVSNAINSLIGGIVGGLL